MTMLAVYDCFFITTASASFSLPQLSDYWKVKKYCLKKYKHSVNSVSNESNVRKPMSGLHLSFRATKNQICGCRFQKYFAKLARNTDMSGSKKPEKRLCLDSF